MNRKAESSVLGNFLVIDKVMALQGRSSFKYTLLPRYQHGPFHEGIFVVAWLEGQTIFICMFGLTSVFYFYVNSLEWVQQSGEPPKNQATMIVSLTFLVSRYEALSLCFLSTLHSQIVCLYRRSVKTVVSSFSRCQPTSKFHESSGVL